MARSVPPLLNNLQLLAQSGLEHLADDPALLAVQVSRRPPSPPRRRIPLSQAGREIATDRRWDVRVRRYETVYGRASRQAASTSKQTPRSRSAD